MARTFYMGDIHGSCNALMQCLERSGFNKEEDKLIQGGDVADGWSQTADAVEELLTIKNLVSIRGNHDEWAADWILNGVRLPIWVMQGGQATIDSYISSGLLQDPKHRAFWKNQVAYHIENDRIFTHGGFNRHELVDEQEEFIFAWDRDLWLAALSHSRMTPPQPQKHPFKNKDRFKEIYIGHTPTINWSTDKPMVAGGYVWNLDTGAGFDGRLTIMDVDTKEFWQSDPVRSLHPLEKGRN